MNEKKLISIILPVYNGEMFLAEAIESILIQTYENFELIIVNDCSKDNSLKIAKHYGQKDSRIKIISNEINKNLPASLNIGHNYAKGEFITWSSDDNILKRDMLKVLINCIIKTNSDIVFSNYDVIETNGTYRRTHNFGPVCSLPFGNSIGASFLYKRKVFECLDGYDKDLHTLEDYDFWLRASIKFKFHHMTRSLYLYRIHKSNLTSAISEDSKKKNTFRKKHRIVYEKISTTLSWSETTITFLHMIRGFEVWDWKFFRNNFNTTVTDLSKFQNRINANDKRTALQKMDGLLRHVILNNNTDKKYIAWLLFKRPGILFDPYYSKKTSFEILKKYFEYN
ncbi:glycosyltransferase family 2 protein [Salegentibacter sp. HM20]